MSDEKQNNEVFRRVEPKSQLNSLSEAVGFEIPVESITLPSKGKVYSVDHPLCNQEKIEIKCMTAKEEDLISSTALINNGTAMSRLMQACLINKLVDPDTLLIGDRNAILIAIRITGYGPKHKAKVRCRSCGQISENDFSVGGLTITPLGDTPVQPNTNLFAFTLPISGLDVVFRLLTGKDELELSQIAERMKKLEMPETPITSRLVQSVVSIGETKELEKVAYMVQNLRAGDARALRKHINKISPGVNMKQWTKCKNCGEEWEVEMPLGANFFWPDFDA